MDIRDQLLQELSHFNMHYIAGYVNGDRDKFSEIMSILLTEKDPLPARAAWVAELVSSNHPEFFKPYIGRVIEKLPEFSHPGSRRNSLKIMTRMEIPDEFQGPLIDICFEWMANAERTVAVKVFAMEIVKNHLELYPELAYELKSVIEDQWDKNSAGFKARGRKVLQQIEKYMD